MEQAFRYLVGIDWGTQTHRVAILDGDERAIEQYDAAHSGEGLVALVNKLKQRTACEPALVAIGIEVAWGALVENLVENGFSLSQNKWIDFATASPWPVPRTMPEMHWRSPPLCAPIDGAISK